MHRILEAAEDDIAVVGEEELLARRQFSHDVCGEDLTGLGACADAGRDLYGGTKEITVLGYGFAGGEADAHTDA